MKAFKAGDSPLCKQRTWGVSHFASVRQKDNIISLAERFFRHRKAIVFDPWANGDCAFVLFFLQARVGPPFPAWAADSDCDASDRWRATHLQVASTEGLEQAGTSSPAGTFSYLETYGILRNTKETDSLSRGVPFQVLEQMLAFRRSVRT